MKAKNCTSIEEIFPQFKKSEDEKIRHFLINFVKINDGVNLPPDYAKKALSWLEKQGEKKSAWKPSDAQMQTLKEACDKYWEPDGLDPLYTLYEQLKKLKGE